MQGAKKTPIRKDSVQISISMPKEALSLINELAKKSGVSRSEYISKIALKSPQDGILKIEYRTQKQLEICVTIYSLQKEDPPSYLKITDDSEIKKIEVGGMSVKFITQIIIMMQEYSEVVSIKLDYKEPKSPPVG